LGAVRDGDEIRVDVANRRLDLLISDDELQERRSQWTPSPSLHLRGYPRLYIDHVLQADRGCDFDFLRPAGDESLSWIEPIIGRS
jgi:dihydroxy-acid dehydratase